ncbi:MAG: BTAD domain-containing putative transcriptional regulator [Gemmatimonadaceae bacterium]
MDSVRFQLRVLGPTELALPDGRTDGHELLTPKRVALFAYLALEAMEGFRRRDQLVALFWPELPQETARAQLRKAIAAIRETLGADVIVNRGEGELRMASEGLWCDAIALGALVTAGQPRDALALYRGELLEGLFPEGVGQEFHDWLGAKRQQLRSHAAAAAWACAREEEDRGDRKAASVMARRALALVPDDEDGIRRLMSILDRHGDRAGALRVYADWQQRLKTEYGVEPAPETRKLARKVQAARKGESHETPPTHAALAPYVPEAWTTPPSVSNRGLFRSRPRVIAAAAIIVVMIGAAAAIGRTASPPRQSIAVLPLRAIGGADDATAALSEELVTGLAESGLAVRIADARAPDAIEDARLLGERMRVAFVLDGGIQRSGGRLRVTLRVLSTDDGFVRWAGSYDLGEAEMSDSAHRVATDVVRQIAERLR